MPVAHYVPLRYNLQKIFNVTTLHFRRSAKTLDHIEGLVPKVQV